MEWLRNWDGWMGALGEKDEDLGIESEFKYRLQIRCSSEREGDDSSGDQRIGKRYAAITKTDNVKQ